MKTLFDPRLSLTYVGSIQMPAVVGSAEVVHGRGLTTRTLSGVDKLLFTGFTSQVGGDLALLLEADLPDLTALSTVTPTALGAVTNYGNIATGTVSTLGTRIERVTGLHYDATESALIVNSGSEYDSHPYTLTIGHAHWTGAAWTPQGRVGVSINGSPRSGKAGQGGVCDIPAWFADTYCGGKRLGVGWGGYRSVVATGPASMGPALCAIDFPPTISDLTNTYVPGVELVNYPFSATIPANGGPDRCRRSDDYINQFGGDYLWQTLHSSWTWDDWMFQAGIWIDTDDTSAVVCFPSLLVGRGWYQNATLNWTNTKHALMVYDPADLAAVATGAKHSWEVQPTINIDWQFPGLTYPLQGGRDEPHQLVIGCATDPSGLYLLVMVRQAGPVVSIYGKVPLIYVYRITSVVTPPDPPPPPPTPPAAPRAAGKPIIVFKETPTQPATGTGDGLTPPFSWT